jgi:hypothetical protein
MGFASTVEIAKALPWPATLFALGGSNFHLRADIFSQNARCCVGVIF